MRSDKFLWKVCMEIYRQMYKEASPSADFDELIENGEAKKEGWFLKYFLSMDRQVEIFEGVLKKYKCGRRERSKIGFEVWLGCSPGSKEVV